MHVQFPNVSSVIIQENNKQFRLPFSISILFAAKQIPIIQPACCSNLKSKMFFPLYSHSPPLSSIPNKTHKYFPHLHGCYFTKKSV